MTISPEMQDDDRRRLILGMLELLPESACYDDVIVSVADVPTVQYLTTWRTAQGDGLLSPHHDSGGPNFALTGQGWREAMRISGRLNDETTLMRCQALMAFLKKLVDDAESPLADQLFEWQYAGPPNVPPAWNYNVIASGLLIALFPNHRINVYRHRNYPSKFFRVPADFGRKLVQ